MGPFGVKGWIKVKTFTERADGLAAYPEWLLRTRQGWRSVAVESFQVKPAATTAKISGVDDRDAAEALRGMDVAVPRESLPAPGEGELYWVDLVGLAVVNQQGEPLGRVSELLRAGGADVLVVQGERERLIPFVPDYVKSVDRGAGRIAVDWEAGYDA